MAATGRSSLSSPQRLHNHHHNHTHHHQQQRSASPCNLNLRLKFSPGNNTPKQPSASSPVAVANQKRKCLCSPTTHPGSFRCAFHRRLENEKKIGTLNSPAKGGGGGGGGNTARNVGLNMWKQAMVNSLARIGTVEAERLRRSLEARLVKPSYLNIRRRPEFRPKLSRFHVLSKDQD